VRTSPYAKPYGERWTRGATTHRLEAEVDDDDEVLEVQMEDYVPLVLSLADAAPSDDAVGVAPASPRRLAPVRLDPGVTLRGRVIDELGRPLALRWVWLEQRDLRNRLGEIRRQAETHADGTFEIRAARVGAAEVSAWNGSEKVETAVDVRPETRPVELRLPALAHVTGCVLDAEGMPVGGARIRVLDPRRSALSDRAGRFRLALRAGTYRLVVPGETKGSVLVERSLVLAPSEATDVVLRLPP
jgi:hypothetical protein